MGHGDALCHDELQFCSTACSVCILGQPWKCREADSWSYTSYVPTFTKVIPDHCSSLVMAISTKILEWIHEQFVNRNKNICQCLRGMVGLY